MDSIGNFQNLADQNEIATKQLQALMQEYMTIKKVEREVSDPVTVPSSALGPGDTFVKHFFSFHRAFSPTCTRIFASACAL